MLERELGGVDTDDHEPGLPVRRVPGLQVRQRSQAVDAGVRPEVDEYDLAVQPGNAQRPALVGVDPALDPGEARSGSVVLQRLGPVRYEAPLAEPFLRVAGLLGLLEPTGVIADLRLQRLV